MAVLPSGPGSTTGGAPSAAARVFGALLVLAATVLVAVLESFLVVLRAGTVRIPLSVVLAALAHPILTWCMRQATASRLAMFGPFVTWAAVVLPLGSPRADGDLIITGNNWVSIAFLIVGVGAFTLSLGLLLPVRRAGKGSLVDNGSA